MMALIAFIPAFVHAAHFEQVLIRRLATATSTRQLRLVEAQAEDIRATRLACRVQLSERRVPIACYSALVLEKRFGLTSHAGTTRELDRKCEAASRRLKPTEKLDLKSASPSCREAIRRAAELLAYKLESNE